MRRYYQRVGERYLSAEGESMRFEVGLFFKKRPTERCEMFETRPRRIETQTPQKHERELVTLEILLRRQPRRKLGAMLGHLLLEALFGARLDLGAGLGKLRWALFAPRQFVGDRHAVDHFSLIRSFRARRVFRENPQYRNVPTTSLIEMTALVPDQADAP
jgi:hypothetical protein